MNRARREPHPIIPILLGIAILLMVAFAIHPPGIDVWPIPHASNRAKVNKFSGDARSMRAALTEFHRAFQRLPYPVDSRDDRTAATVLGASPEGVYYYEGPSFPSSELIVHGFLSGFPVDPFRAGKPALTYTYGAGPLSGATAAAVLTSPGPDGISLEQQIERAFLIGHKGNPDAFALSKETQVFYYSPTNGLKSPGDLLRLVRLAHDDGAAR
jgi:hypothetical protein